ncbi:MAG: glycosyltransferase, partial [Clostridia bacterium]|nr:glycosyltransferase [Clostridia bacterium]
MKILIVTGSLGCGGAERVIAQLANEWVGSNNEVTILLVRENDVFYRVRDEVKVEFLKTRQGNPLSRKLSWLRGIRRFVSECKPDVVLSLPEEIGIYVGLALIGRKTRLVVSERNNPYVMPYKKIT